MILPSGTGRASPKSHPTNPTLGICRTSLPKILGKKKQGFGSRGAAGAGKGRNPREIPILELLTQSLEILLQGEEFLLEQGLG